MPDDLQDPLGNEPPDLSDPSTWSPNMIEQSLADLEREPAPSLPEPPAPPAPPAGGASLEERLAAVERERDAALEGLRIQARRAAEAPAPPPAPPAPAGPDYTEQQLRELWEVDPPRAAALMSARIADARSSNVEARVLTMLRASTAIVAQQVQQQYPEEFAAYGDEIRQIVQQFTPENQVDPQAWATAVKLVRAEHMDEIFAKRQAAAAERDAEEARKRQAASAGFARPSRAAGAAGTAPPRENTYGLSPEQQRVATTMGLTFQEYAKYV